MSTLTKTAGAATIGGLMVYFLDPEMGRTRRAMWKDKGARLVREADRAIGKASRDLSNRARGAVAEARSLVPGRGVSDEVLVEQIRSRIGRAVSFPHFVEVTARNANVMLRGSVLRSEVNDLLNAVSSVRNVSSVRDELKTYSEPHDIPGVRDAEPRRRSSAAGWAPGARLAMAIGGGALLLAGRGHRGRLAKTVRLAGLGMLARAIANMQLQELLGIGPGRGIHVQKTIVIDAPAERVFQFLSNYQNLPQFLSHLQEIRRAGNYSHWVAAGPAGSTIEWDARITRYEPNRLLTWKSLPGSTIRTAGTLRLHRLPGPSTQLDLNLSYTPPSGTLRSALALLFGTDPKHTISEDLDRLKDLLETGKVAPNGGTMLPGFTPRVEQRWEHAT
jgi:uncharacterized membrane protein